MTHPTKVKKFILNESLTIEENRPYEFKEIKGNNPIDSIKNTADEYVVAFLNLPNGSGGSIYWGIEDDTRKCVGVKLDDKQRDEIRKNVNNKLFQITPPLTPNSYQINFHHVYDADDEAIPGLRIVEVTVLPSLTTDDLYFASGKTAFIKTDSGRKKLSGLELVDEIKRRARIYSNQEKETLEKETLPLNTFLDLVEDFKPLFYWLHKSVSSQDARRYFSALQIVFNDRYFHANKALLYGADNLLRAFSHFKGIKDDFYIPNKMRSAYFQFETYLKGVNRFDNPLESIEDIDLNINEMMSALYSTFEDLITPYKTSLEIDELLIRFIFSLINYFVKYNFRLLKGEYADIPQSLSDSFRLLAAYEFSTRFGVNLPNVEEDLFYNIEELCEDSWNNTR